MLNKNLEMQNQNSSLADIRLYETFLAKGFSKDEAKEVIADFVELAKRTGQNIETKFDAKLDMIVAEIKLNTARIDSLDSKFTEKFEALDSKFTERTNSLDSKLKLGFGWAIGLNIAVLATVLATVLALFIKH